MKTGGKPREAFGSYTVGVKFVIVGHTVTRRPLQRFSDFSAQMQSSPNHRASNNETLHL